MSDMILVYVYMDFLCRDGLLVSDSDSVSLLRLRPRANIESKLRRIYLK